MIHIEMWQLDKSLNNCYHSFTHALPPPNPRIRIMNRSFRYSTNGAATWLIFTQAWVEIPMTKLHYTLTQLPSEKRQVGVGTGVHTTHTVYSCMRTGLAGGYGGHQVQRELILKKCPSSCLAPFPAGSWPRHRCHARSTPTLHITLQLVSANRCSRLGCRPQHARKQIVIMSLPSIISFFLLFFCCPGEQWRGPT